MKNRSKILAALMPALILLACSKNSQQKVPTSNQADLPKIVRGNLPPIAVVQGILSFNNLSDAKAYISEIEEIHYSELTAFEKNIAIDQIENSYDYLSYRKANTSYRYSEEGIENPENLPKLRFDGVPIQSALNDKLEIIISGEYYNFKFADAYILVRDFVNSDLSAIRQIIASSDDMVACCNQICARGINASVAYEMYDISRKTRGTDYFQYLPTNNKWTLFGTISTLPLCTDKKVTFSDFYANDAGNLTYVPVPGTLLVDWGDGNSNSYTIPPIVVLGAPVAGTAAKFSFSHTYTVQGTYSITFTFIAQGATGTTTAYPVIAGGCIKAQTQSKNIWHYPTFGSTMYAVEKKLWVTNNILYHRIGADTWTYKKKNNSNKWKSFKADNITAKVSGGIASQACVPWNVSNFDSDNNDDDAEACYKVGCEYNLVEVNSVHTATIGGVTHTFTEAIKACP
jgi:hypothetical protein